MKSSLLYSIRLAHHKQLQFKLKYFEAETKTQFLHLEQLWKPLNSTHIDDVFSSMTSMGHMDNLASGLASTHIFSKIKFIAFLPLALFEHSWLQHDLFLSISLWFIAFTGLQHC